MPELRPDSETIVQEALRDGELHRALLDQLEEGLYMVDRDRRILYWNQAAERISGYLAHEVAGNCCHADLLIHCDEEKASPHDERSPLLDVIADGKPREATLFLRHREGHRIPVHVRSRAIHDRHGAIVGAVEVFEDALAQSRGWLRELRPFGAVDEATGAAIRAYGELRVEQAFQALNQFQIPFGWLRIGLDGVEQLEKSFGHGIIDAAMKTIAHTVDGNLGPLDVLTRWDTTEFRVEVHYSSRIALAQMADKLVSLVRVSNLDWWGDRRAITVSVAGGTGEQGDTLESLEARVTGVFESCRAGGGNCAAVVRTVTGDKDSCLPS